MNNTIKLQLDKHHAKFATQEVAAGKYKDANELIIEADEQPNQNETRQKLRQKLQKGIDSGFAEDWDFEEWLKEVKLKYKTHGPTHQ